VTEIPRPRIYRPLCETLESRTVATVSHASLIDSGLAHRRLHGAVALAAADAGGLIPLTELGPGSSYEGQDGGLYGGGSNQPPQSLLDAALAASAAIRPLDRGGHPAAGGRIGVVTIGQSTTQQWFPYFRAMARPLARRVVFIDAGQDGMAAQNWATEGAPWSTAIRAAGASGLSNAQVQVLIVDAVRIFSWTDGDLEGQIRATSDTMARIVAVAKSRFPDLKLVYLMPFHYAGFAGEGRAIREPYAYQQQFGIRRLILDQSGDSPVLLWGPYVFSGTMNPAYYYDGIHFSRAGRQAMASLTWQFFRTDPAASRWLWNS
jgi:hypothetical protein